MKRQKEGESVLRLAKLGTLECSDKVHAGDKCFTVSGDTMKKVEEAEGSEYVKGGK